MTPANPSDRYIEELTVVTERVRLLTESAATSGRYEVFEIRSTREGGVPLHRHPWDEEFHVLEGTLEVFTYGRLEIIDAGSSLRVTAGTFHAWRSAGGSARFLSIVSPGGVSKLFREIHAAGPTVSRAELAKLNEIHDVELVISGWRDSTSK